MPTLQVEDVPDEVMEHLRARAAEKRLTVSEEARRLIERALRDEEILARESHLAALADLRRRRWTPPPGTPDSAELIRSDRQADEIDAEVDFSQGIRGKHYHAYREGTRVTIHRRDGTTEERDFALPEGTVVLDPDVREHFSDSDAVNRALRGLLDLVPHR